MKTLGKLRINSEKMLKNEELVNLKGGYEMAIICCNNWSYNLGKINCQSGIGPSEAMEICIRYFPGTTYVIQC